MIRLIRLGLVLAGIGLASVASAQPAPCTAKDGKGIVACVEQRYPEKLIANVSLAERKANAEFLRNRVIETARCAGFDVGLNLKRGGPVISTDFIAWRHDGITEGVDIIGSWDNLNRVLSLSWHRYDAPTYGHPTYKPYGPVSCLLPPDRTTPEPEVDETAELRARIIKMETMFEELVAVVNQNAIALQAVANELTNEQTNRKAVDDEHNKTLDVLKSRPIPTGCSVRALGIGLRCRLVE